MNLGPKLTNDNLLFGYDTCYTSSGVNLSSSRFFKGPHHTNLAQEIDYSISNQSSSAFHIRNSVQEVDIPEVGVRNVKYVEYYNNGHTCCPNLFHYFASAIAVDSSSSYTYSIIYKHDYSYHHPNFMYHYQQTAAGATLTEGGVSSTASDRRTHLGDGWYHAWGNISTQATCNKVLLYSFLYNQGTVKHKFYVAAVSLVKNTTGETFMKIPPHLMLEPLGSVSDTVSLIDLKKSSTIDTGDISHDDFGQPTFDGSNDCITLSTNFGTLSRYSFEYVCDTTVVNKMPITATTGFYKYGANSWYYTHGGTAGEFYHGTAVNNGVHHWVVTYNGSQVEVFQDGASLGTKATTGTANFANGLLIGKHSGGYYWNGHIQVVKFYDRALTTSEVVSNFKAYKNRFNI